MFMISNCLSISNIPSTNHPRYFSVFFLFSHSVIVIDVVFPREERENNAAKMFKLESPPHKARRERERERERERQAAMKRG